jgi:CRAL/TRIO domain
VFLLLCSLMEYLFTQLFQEGRPLSIECIGNLNMKALNAVTTTERQLQRLVLEYETSLTKRLPACSISIGHPVETFCTIFDLGGVSLSNFYHVKDYISAAASIGQDRYPETMGKFYIINASWAFSAIWAMIKPWLDEVTAAKIQIVGGGYKEVLLKGISKENLPKELGGECVCVGGCSMSDAGPWNPEGGKEILDC